MGAREEVDSGGFGEVRVYGEMGAASFGETEEQAGRCSDQRDQLCVMLTLFVKVNSVVTCCDTPEFYS